MIYLLRHCNKTDEAAEAPLSNKGFQQAEAIVPALEALGIKRIISSPYKRAQQSVAPFAKTSGLLVETNVALSEWQHSGSSHPNWQASFARGLAAPHTAAEGGEAAAQVWARAQTVLSQTVPTLLVSHGGWLTIVLGHFGRPASLASLLDTKSPDLFSIDNQRWKHHEL